MVPDGIWKFKHCVYCHGSKRKPIEFKDIISEYVHLRIVGINPKMENARQWTQSITEECPMCKGSNETKVWACPRRLADARVCRLLPFFFEYYNSQNGSIWPDGKGRLYQPLKLIDAFELMATIKLEMDKPKGGK